MLEIYFKICYNIDMKNYYEIHRDSDNSITCLHSVAPFKKEHYHSKIEICYALTDGIEFMLNREIVKMKKDSLIIADSFDVHSTLGKGEYLTLIVPDVYFESYKQLKGTRTLSRKYFTDKDEVSKLYFIVQEIFKQNSADNTNYIQLEGLVKYLLGTIISFSGFTEEKLPTSYDTLKEVLIFINNNYRQELTLDKISSALGLNKHYVSHLMSKALDSSFNDYVNGLRVDYFANNIDSTENISKVALDSGFQSLATFYRAFDKIYGCSPKKFIDEKNSDLKH